MNKAKVSIITAIVAVVVIIGAVFSVNAMNKNSAVSNEQFAKALTKALEDRWRISDKIDWDAENKEDWKKLIDAELDVLEPYADKKFQNEETKKEVLQYIKDLKSQKKALKYYGTDDFYIYWDAAYAQRALDLTHLVKKYKIKSYMPKNKLKNFDEILAQGKKVKEDNEVKDKLNKIFSKVTFEQEPDAFEGSEYHEYFAVVENTTGINLNTVMLNVKLIGQDGVTEATETVSVNSWMNGDKTKVKFMTNASFEKAKAVVSWYEEDK